MSLQVVCWGETMAQLVPIDDRPLSDAGTFAVGTAGGESNVACSLAQLGVGVGWVSRLGDDPLADRVLRDLAAFGVDAGLAVRVPGAQTGLFLKDAAASASPVYYYRRNSAAAQMDRTDVDRALAPRPRLMHLTGVTPALSVSCRDAAAYAVAAARDSGTTVSFDVNHRPQLWPAAAAAGVLRTLAAGADIVFVGLDEAERLWGTGTAEAVREILPGPAVVVVKDGERLATCLCHTPGRHRQPALPVPVVEPVGAGDAFAAGWLAGLIHGLSHDARLALGHLVAAEVLGSVFDVVRLADPAGLIRRATEGVRP